MATPRRQGIEHSPAPVQPQAQYHARCPSRRVRPRCRLARARPQPARRPYRPRRPDAVDLPQRPRPDHRRRLPAGDLRRLRRPRPAGLGDLRLHGGDDRVDADLWQARRSLRAAPTDALRHRRVQRRLAALRAGAEHGPAGAGAGAAGDRRGRVDGGQPGDRRRHRPAARTRALPGLFQQHVRHRQRRRTGARRPAHRIPVVALGILDQPADRPARAGHLAANPGRPAGAAPAAADRLPGHRADGGRSHRPAAGHHPDRPGCGLERPGAARPVRPGGGRPAAVHSPGAAFPRAAGADAAVLHPRRHPQLAGGVLRQFPGHLADRAGAAALPERHRRRRRQRRAAPAAAGHGPAAGQPTAAAG